MHLHLHRLSLVRLTLVTCRLWERRPRTARRTAHDGDPWPTPRTPTPLGTQPPRVGTRGGRYLGGWVPRKVGTQGGGYPGVGTYPCTARAAFSIVCCYLSLVACCLLRVVTCRVLPVVCCLSLPVTCCLLLAAARNPRAHSRPPQSGNANQQAIAARWPGPPLPPLLLLLPLLPTV